MKRIATTLALCVLAGGLLSLVSWQVRKPGEKLVDGVDGAHEGQRESTIAAQQVSQMEPRRPSKHLSARNPKPDQGRLDWSQTDHLAFDLLNEDRPGAAREAVELLEDEAVQPEPWLIEMRRRVGMTNPYAPIGPTSEEIEEWARGKVRPEGPKP